MPVGSRNHTEPDEDDDGQLRVQSRNDPYSVMDLHQPQQQQATSFADQIMIYQSHIEDNIKQIRQKLNASKMLSI